MRLLGIVWLMLLTSACVSHETRVSCDGKLQPINVAASAQQRAPQASP